jgi:hypothetical protein
MAFENLLNQPDDELAILRKVAEDVRVAYASHIGNYHYLKLKKADNGQCEVSWVKTFDNESAYDDQNFSSPFVQAKIAVVSCETYIAVRLLGFRAQTRAKVFADRVEYHRVISCLDDDLESELALPREVIEGFLLDLKGQFRAKKIGAA